MTRTTMTVRDNSPEPMTHTWDAADTFNMEHATNLCGIGQHEWPDTTPRTDRPARFRVAKGWASTLTRITFGW